MDLTWCFVNFLPVVCVVSANKDALVEVVTSTKESSDRFERETVGGAFTTIGAISSAEGDAVQVSKTANAFQFVPMDIRTVPIPPVDHVPNRDCM